MFNVKLTREERQLLMDQLRKTAERLHEERQAGSALWNKLYLAEDKDE